MAEKKTALWKLIVAYTAFSIFALVTAFLVSFPYDALKERLRLEADHAGYFVRIGSVGPGFFAVRASDVQLSKKADEKSDEQPESMKIDSISVGPTLFPPGVAVSLKTMGGKIAFKSSFTGTRLKVDVEELDLSKGNLKGFSGIDLSGTIDAHLDLSLPRTAVGGGPAEPDLGQATGSVALETKNLTVNGGNVTVPIAQYGPEPVPLSLPRIAFGELVGKLKIEKGLGTIEEFRVKSTDLEASATGTVKLAKRLEYSEPNVELRFKPDPEFQKRLGLIGAALSVVGADPKDSSWRMGRLQGFLGKPSFR